MLNIVGSVLVINSCMPLSNCCVWSLLCGHISWGQIFAKRLPNSLLLLCPPTDAPQVRVAAFSSRTAPLSHFVTEFFSAYFTFPIQSFIFNSLLSFPLSCQHPCFNFKCFAIIATSALLLSLRCATSCLHEPCTLMTYCARAYLSY